MYFRCKYSLFSITNQILLKKSHILKKNMENVNIVLNKFCLSLKVRCLQVSQKTSAFNPPYSEMSPSGGGVKGSFSHFSRSIFVNVFRRSDTTRFANAFYQQINWQNQVCIYLILPTFSIRYICIFRNIH